MNEQPVAESGPIAAPEEEFAQPEAPGKPLPPLLSGKRPSRLPPDTATPVEAPSISVTPAPFLDTGPASPKPGGVLPGGYAPLGSLGQTNYRTAILGRVVLHGSAPPEQPLDAAADAYCAEILPKPLMTRFYAVSTNGGLSDVLVLIREGLPRHPPARVVSQAHLQFANCQLGPYMGAVTQRQPLTLENKDATLHVLRVTPQHGRESVTSINPRATASLLIRSEPELFIPCRCQLHPWETAYISVLEYPFFAVTDADGRYSITNIPPGTYALEAIHQKIHGTNGPTRQVTIAVGQTLTNNFEIEPPQPAPAERDSTLRSQRAQAHF